MVKVKAIRNFRDLKEKKNRKIGDVFGVSPDRFNDLYMTEHGSLVEKIEEETTKEDEETNETDGKIDPIALTKMKKEDLVKYAKEVMEIELNMEMTKAEMIELLEK